MKVSKIIALVAIAMVSVGCKQTTKQSKLPDNGIKSVGILQYIEHPSLDDARIGFVEELAANGFVDGENIKIHSENAQGQQANLQTIAEKLVLQNEVTLGIATPAAQALANVESDKPILFTAVSDPVGAELMPKLQHHHSRITGVSDAVPVDKQIEMLLRIKPSLKKVGVMYTATERNAEVQAKEAIALLKEKGIEVVVKTLSSTNDVQDVTTTLANQVEAIVIPTDNLIASSIDTVVQITVAKKIMVVGSSPSEVKAGVLFTYGVDYKQLGRQTAKLVVRLLNGERIESIYAQYSESVELVVNEETAKAIGVDVSALK